MGNDSGELGHNLMDHHFQLELKALSKDLRINTIPEEDLTEFIFLDLEISAEIQIRKTFYEDTATKVVEVEADGHLKLRSLVMVLVLKKL